MRDQIARLYRRWAKAPATVRVVGILVLVAFVFAFGRGVSVLGEAIIAFIIVDAYISSRVRRNDPLDELGFPSEGIARDVTLGAVGATALISATIAVFAIEHWYRVVDVSLGPRTLLHFAGGIVLFIFVAIVEEVLSRGMVWRLLERRFGSWAALLGTSLLFGLAHLTNPHASLRAGLAIASEAGLLFGAVFLLTRSLWAPMGMHFAWNLFEGPVYGTQVSGLHESSIIHSVTRGPTLWTGGQFGPEAGMVCLILGTAVAVVLLWVAVRTNRFQPAKFVLRPNRERKVPAV